MSSISYIDQNWFFTQVGGGKATKNGEWIPTTSFPTTVHVELIKKGLISDPFVGLNEHRVQWVGEADWAFKTKFDVSEKQLSVPNADLIFEGLDTYATVELNGIIIHKSSNQFIPYRVPVKEVLKLGANDLVLTFASAWYKGKDLEKKHGKLILWNGDSSRLHVRKAQYNYGWDWGPVLMTVGPWRPIYLQTFENRFKDLRIRTDVSNLQVAKITASFQTSLPDGTVVINLKDLSGKIIKYATSKVSNYKAEISFELKEGEFELWWPTGYGKQPLYTVSASLSDEKGLLQDNQEQRIGIRKVRIVEDKLVDQEGRTFLFEVNNVKIFCGGSNWIPADSFLTTVTESVYRSWLQLMVEGNQNMVRVWGGGVYEADVFYDICDEIGLLVWQDFMFGCGQYPAYDEFLERLVPEVEANVKRLRHHPSIVVFAGNNEDYQLAEANKLELDYGDENPNSDFRKTNFPARHIYERVLPSITRKLSDIHYHRASPYSGFGKLTTDPLYGDIHQWNVWHGSQEPWHNWDILAGRFVSEFGMEAFPNIRTVDFWLGGDKDQRYTQSQIMTSHNKADGFERRLELYLVENFKHSFNLESYIYYTQIMQAETLGSAYRLWRRNWKGPGREYTAGALVWQINDCWPVTSWAIVDYFLRPKPSFFTIARELKTFTVGMTRKDKKTFADDQTAADYTIDADLQIWGTNSTLKDVNVTLDVTSFDLQSSWTTNFSKKVTLLANQSTELFQGSVPGQPVRTNTSELKKDIIVSARFLDDEGKVLARYSNWPEPFKFINFPSTESVGLKISTDGDNVTLSCLKPVKGIVLDVEGEDVKWSDQAIDLVPNDPQVVRAVGLGGRKILARYLGDEEE